MFRSLYVKLMVTYSIILIATLIVLGLLLSSFFQNSILDKRKQELEREGNALAPYFEFFSYGLIDVKTLEGQFKVIDRFLNVSIWMTDTTGLIYYVYPESEAMIWRNHRLNDEVLKPVLDGETLTLTGNFGDRFSIPVLTVGMPIRLNNRIIGTIFMHSPVQEVNRTLRDTYRSIWRSAFFSSILSMLLLYYVSRRISKPLTEMNTISREIASGNFKRRVKVTTEDEVGQLGVNFNAMADSLESLEQMRRSFVANVSHELRSPLTSMKGYIQGILDKTIKPEEQDKYLRVVLDETERMNRLINGLLDLAQVESGQFSIDIKVFDINEKIRRILIAHEERISESNMEVEVKFGEDVLSVEADPDRIQQVVINLLDNAIKFNRPGGTISIETWRHKELAFVRIADQGQGIPKEEIAHIWEPFYQVDKSRSSRKVGTGLGLSIVKKIIDAHSQQIWVNSTPGAGTAFVFSLKAVKSRQ
ncbi:MAG TPA: HAMP domain-containing sensor histidine kinase [Candidatus Atribacteria bacterium]|nr:HAMP domain-containing sensor histidine kinase [Candidatus Atribacteria bacterium]